jgi:hypothetical protein
MDIAEGEEFDLTYEDKEGGRNYYHNHLVSFAWNALAALEKAIVDRGITTEYIDTWPAEDEEQDKRVIPAKSAE